jgi:hypothetical protein
MESIKQWFQDWFDACEYAKECVPDFSFLVPPEPYSALGVFAALCFFLWWLNETQIGRVHVHQGGARGSVPSNARTSDGKPQFGERSEDYLELPRAGAAK